MNYKQVISMNLCAVVVSVSVSFSTIAMDKQLVAPAPKKSTRSTRSFTVNAREVVDNAKDQKNKKNDHPIKHDPAYLARVVNKHEQKKDHRSQYEMSETNNNNASLSVSNSSYSSQSSSSSTDCDANTAAVINMPIKSIKTISIFEHHQRSNFGQKLDARNEREKKTQIQMKKKADAKAKREALKAANAAVKEQKLSQRAAEYTTHFDDIDRYNLQESCTPEQKNKKKNQQPTTITRSIIATDLSTLPFDINATIELESSSEESNVGDDNSFGDANTVSFDYFSSTSEKENNNPKALYSATKPALLRNNEDKLDRMQRRLHIAQNNPTLTGRLDLYRHKKELAKDAKKRS